MNDRTYSELTKSLATHSKRQSEDRANQKILSERDRYHALKRAYIALCNEKGMDSEVSLRKLTKRWLELKHGPNNGMSSDSSLFEQCALFDLDKVMKIKGKGLGVK